MIVKMEVEFDREEVYEICKAEYVKKFGPPAEGYELHASGSYGDVKVYTAKKVEPAPADPVTREPIATATEL